MQIAILLLSSKPSNSYFASQFFHFLLHTTCYILFIVAVMLGSIDLHTQLDLMSINGSTAGLPLGQLFDPLTKYSQLVGCAK
jgi:hypothetical protein